MIWCSKHFGGPTPNACYSPYLHMLRTPIGSSQNCEKTEVLMVYFSMGQVRVLGSWCRGKQCSANDRGNWRGNSKNIPQLPLPSSGATLRHVLQSPRGADRTELQLLTAITYLLTFFLMFSLPCLISPACLAKLLRPCPKQTFHSTLLICFWGTQPKGLPFPALLRSQL